MISVIIQKYFSYRGFLWMFCFFFQFLWCFFVMICLFFPFQTDDGSVGCWGFSIPPTSRRSTEAHLCWSSWFSLILWFLSVKCERYKLMSWVKGGLVVVVNPMRKKWWEAKYVNRKNIQSAVFCRDVRALILLRSAPLVLILHHVDPSQFFVILALYLCWNKSTAMLIDFQKNYSTYDYMYRNYIDINSWV